LHTAKYVMHGKRQCQATQPCILCNITKVTSPDSWTKMGQIHSEKNSSNGTIIDRITTSGQSKGEHSGTAFPHLLFSVSVVPPP